MDSLYRKNTAAEGVTPPPPNQLLDIAPAKLALAFLYDLSCALSADPHVLYTAGDGTLTALYRGSCYACDDFLQDYQAIAAALSRRWQLTVFGTVEGMEVGELGFTAEGEGARWVRRNTSGRDFSALTDLCVQLTAPTPADCGALAEAAARLRSSGVCIAVHRKREAFWSAAALGQMEDGAHFCYLPMARECDMDDRLACLSIEDKEELWMAYLADGVSPREFDWVMEAFRAGSATGLLEWELALRLVLPRLGITVENEPEHFQITGVDGTPIRLGYTTAPGAGKLLLKIIFPVKAG